MSLFTLPPGTSGCTKTEPPPIKVAVQFNSLIEAWTQMEAVTMALKATTAMGELGDTASEIQRVADMGTGLLPLSTTYFSSHESPLEFGVRDLARIAGLARQAADAGDRNAVIDAVTKMRRTLRYIHGLYPPGVLPAVSPGLRTQ